MQKITPCLWFDTQAEDAASYYCSIFKNSRILDVSRYGEAGPREAGLVMVVEMEIEGQRFTLLNGGPEFTFDEAISFQVDCVDQAEVDELWERLTADGGEESQCGWLKDKYGVSWQIIPKRLRELLAEPDPQRQQRAWKAMLGMRKIEVAELEKAAAG